MNEPVRLPLRARDGSVRAYALVDAEDAPSVAPFRWCLLSRVRGYAVRNDPGAPKGSQRLLYMHRVLLGLVPGDGLEADHINRDTLDNRRCNLRIATRALNGQNLPSWGASPYRGVTYHRPTGKWEARAVLNYERIYLGLFQTEADAAVAAAVFRAKHMPFSDEARAA